VVPFVNLPPIHRKFNILNFQQITQQLGQMFLIGLQNHYHIVIEDAMRVLFSALHQSPGLWCGYPFFFICKPKSWSAKDAKNGVVMGLVSLGDGK
jgi:hypothetical protein